MKTFSIKLSTIDAVRNFVSAVTAYEGDIDLASGRYVVDGKSIMGIFSLDLTKPVKLIFHDETKAEELFNLLSKYVVDAPEA